jgi:WD40 repeat protein
VVPLVDYWREPNRAVMVSRLITGGHLGRRIPGDGMDAAEALAIFETVASGIAFAHRHGVVHGRIRPENVLFDGEGNAYVADLGVDEICTGVVTFATSAYDAPERLGGILATPAADVYSLGVMAHHLLGGSPPPADGPLPLGEGPVAGVVLRATDPDPARRHGSVGELMADLRDALAVPVDPATVFVPARNPYRGLEAFEQADAGDFHGRDRAVAEMVAILQRERLLVVVGPSGIGKSSAVKAGLVPALSRGAIAGSESWLVTEMVPGRVPFEQLAAALGRVANVALPDIVGELTTDPAALDDIVHRLVPRATAVLVVVDQLEELFTQTVDERHRRAFLQMMVELALRPAAAVRLVATLRADYFDRPLGYPGVGDTLRGRTIALGAMTAADLADAVRLPAAAVGVEIERALVDRIAAEAEQQPGALPLVQHTMAELFERRETNTITLAGFDELGGLAGSIGRRAEAIYESFDDGAREAARRVFLRLVSVSENHEDTRRRVRRTELEQSGVHADDLEAVLAEYGGHRLLTFDRDPASRTPTVELAHEALLTEWGRYRAWVEEARDDLLTRRQVESAAHDWLNADSDASFLYGGGRLELAEAWAASSGFELTDDEHRFLATSRANVDRDQVVRSRRRRIVVGVLAAALVVATVGGGVALVQRRDADRQAAIASEQQQEAERQAAIAGEQRQEADRQAAIAEEQRQEAERAAERADQTAEEAELAADRADQAAIEADARRVGTQALVTDSIDESLLMAVAGVRLDDSSDTRANLLTALTRNPALVAATRSAEPLQTVDASFDGKVVALGGPFRGIAFHDAATLAPLGSFPDPPWTLEFQPGGTTLAMAADPISPDGPQQLDKVPVVIVDAATFEPVETQLGGLPARASVTGLEYSANGRYLVVAFALYGDDFDAPTGGAVAVWDLDSPEQPARRFDADSVSDFGWVGLSPDGALLYTGSDGGASVVVRDVATGTLVDSVAIAHVGGEVSPDGAVVAVADGGDVVLLDAATLTELRRLAGQANLTTLQFSRDGTRFATGTEDGAVTVWDVATGAAVDQFRGHSGRVEGLAFSPDGATLYTVSPDKLLLAWDLDGSRRFVAEDRSPAMPANADYPIVIRNGELITYVSGLSGQPDAMQFLDLTANEMSPRVEVGHGGIGDIRTRPPDSDQVATTGRDGFVRIWDRSTGRLLSERDVDGQRLAYSADGERILVGGADGAVAVIDADTLEPLAPPIQLDHPVVGLQASPDDRTAIALTSAPGIALVDTVDGTVLHERRIELDPISADFSPDGERVAIALQAGEVAVLDVSTAEWVRTPLDGHHSMAITVRYSPDGDTLVSGGLDGRVALWDGNTGALLGSIVVSPNVATAAGFAPDGHTVIIASTDGTLARWDTQVEHWMSAACAIAGRSLTPAEWAAILPNRPYIDTCP